MSNASQSARIPSLPLLAFSWMLAWAGMKLSLPALPELEGIFNTSGTALRTTVMVFFICFAFGQLAWGIISGCGAFVTSLSGDNASHNRARNTGRAPRRPSAPEPLARLDDNSPRSSRLQRTQIPSGDEGKKPRPRRPRRPSRPKQEE